MENHNFNQLEMINNGVIRVNKEMRYFTPTPSGKQRQKKSGRGRPTASFIASVITPVMSTEKRSPEDPKNTP